MNATGARKQERLRQFVSDYRPVDGIPDELLDSAGQIRPVWSSFMAQLSSLSPEDLTARFARGDQYLHDAGVFFRRPESGASSERQWPLSHMPVLISASEWQAIEADLSQRADLLEAVMRDLYGENQLVANGLLPPELVASNPEWLRPLVGTVPRSGHYLHLIAFELGRSPSGAWWVLNDRTQAPSGPGFALENRVASSRIYADLFTEANVHRLAGFFRSLRNAILDMRDDPDSLAAILTPGPMSDTYYEHAYIARYLGLTLAEGEDLVVENGRPMVRTVTGLKPISVLWRRLDSLYTDPLELAESSRIGAPGLVGAVRQGNVTMLNALGSGILETRAFLAFYPRICEHLLGEPLRMPNIATWWCGQPKERETVKAIIARMTLSSALSTRLPFDPEDTPALGGRLRSHKFQSIDDLLEHEAAQLVGQEAVTLSTTPALKGGVLMPRPMSIRVFMVRTKNGWQSMPGGYARIGASDDVTAVGMRQGGSVADVWVIANGPVTPDTLITHNLVKPERSTENDLTSRAAENLFWLGRYVERAEGYLRLTRAYEQRLWEHGRNGTALLKFMAAYLQFLGVEPEQSMPSALSSAIGSAVLCGRRIRDRLSPDGWAVLADLDTAANADATIARIEAGHVSRKGELLRAMAAFTGLLHENMHRNVGWRFLSIGRALERAAATLSMLARFTDSKAPEGALEALLECCDSAISYRRRYAFAISRETIIDFLVYDKLNPRAVCFQLRELLEQIRELPESDATTGAHRTILQLHTDFAVRTAHDIDTSHLLSAWSTLATVSDQLHATYMQ